MHKRDEEEEQAQQQGEGLELAGIELAEVLGAEVSLLCSIYSLRCMSNRTKKSRPRLSSKERGSS